MTGGTPDRSNAAWQSFFSRSSGPRSRGGQRVAGTTSQPESDPDEPWSELPPLKKVPVMMVWDLIERLRAAGVPVLGSGPRRSGVFSRGMVDATLRVPDKLLLKAQKIVADHLAGI